MSVSTTKLFFPRKTKNPKTKHDKSVVQNGKDLKGGGDLVGSPPESEVRQYAPPKHASAKPVWDIWSNRS